MKPLTEEQLKKTITTDVGNCSRCGGDHSQLLFTPLKRRSAYSHWTTCPETGEPIVLEMHQRHDVTAVGKGAEDGKIGYDDKVKIYLSAADILVLAARNGIVVRATDPAYMGMLIGEAHEQARKKMPYWNAADPSQGEAVCSEVAYDSPKNPAKFGT